MSPERNRGRIKQYNYAIDKYVISNKKDKERKRTRPISYGMRNFQQKRGWRNIVESKPFLILFGILLLFFAWNVFSFWNKMQETVKNRQIIEDKVTVLRQRKENILSEINSLKTDEGKEKFFRENLSLAKDGEGVIMIVEDKNAPKIPLEANSGGFFSFLRNWFK